MEFHEITMFGPLNTDNIRASDGTLAATISDSSGDVAFDADVEVGIDLDVNRDATIFRNLEVQGPLATIIQDMDIGGNLDVTGDITADNIIVTTDLDVSNDLGVINNAVIGGEVRTVDLRVTGNAPAAGKVLEAVDAAGNVTWGIGATISAVPAGESILFYKNGTVSGYTIETLIADDEVVYITKGSAAGGQAGGAAKPGSVWGHAHTGGSHVLTINEMPSHTHGCSPDNTSGGGGDREAGPGNSALTTATGGGAAHNHGNTSSNTGWRPKGHNFTLQTRN